MNKAEQPQANQRGDNVADPLESLNLGDGRLASLLWPTDELLVMEFVYPTTGRCVRLQFTWVTSLRIQMAFGQYMGRPLLFGAEALPLDRGRWAVEFRFGASPEGFIAFECNEVAASPS